MNIRILTPSVEDADAIQAVFDETWLDTYPNAAAGITRDDILDSRQKSFAERLARRRQMLSQSLPNRKFMIAKDDSLVVGVCDLIKEELTNKLGAIYILSAYQGKGIGKQLWEAGVPFLDKEKDIIVQVATYNQKAIAFYEKLGFTDTGKRFSDEKFRLKSGALIPEMEMAIKADANKMFP